MKPEGMNVSVAIATYNRPEMVRQAVAAALANNPREILVSDDASTLGSLPFESLTALAHLDPRIRVLRRQHNSGGIPNCNDAVNATTSAYIAWCSDDDRFTADHLSRSLEFLEAHPDVGFVHSSFIDAVESPEVTFEIPRPLRFPADRIFHPRDLARYLVRYYDWPFHPSTLVMRRRVWEETGPFDPHFALADTDWFARAAEKFPVAILARHGVYNRRHPGNWSNRLGSARMQREIREIVERSLNRLYAARPVARFFWRAVWRTNVRLRLALTLAVRARTGHGDAAALAWQGAIEGLLPSALARAGEQLIRGFARRRAPQFDEARQSVSPL